MPNTRYILWVLVCFSSLYVTIVRSDANQSTVNKNAEKCYATLNVTQQAVINLVQDGEKCESALNSTQQSLIRSADDVLRLESDKDSMRLQVGAMNKLFQQFHMQHDADKKALEEKSQGVKFFKQVWALILPFVWWLGIKLLGDSILNSSLMQLDEKHVALYSVLYVTWFLLFWLMDWFLDDGLFLEFQTAYIGMGIIMWVANVLRQLKFYLDFDILNVLDKYHFLKCTHRQLPIEKKVMLERVKYLHLLCVKMAPFIFFGSCVIRAGVSWTGNQYTVNHQPVACLIFQSTYNRCFHCWSIGLKHQVEFVFLTQYMVAPVWICYKAQSADENFAWISQLYLSMWRLLGCFVHAWYIADGLSFFGYLRYANLFIWYNYIVIDALQELLISASEKARIWATWSCGGILSLYSQIILIIQRCDRQNIFYFGLVLIALCFTLFVIYFVEPD